MSKLFIYELPMTDVLRSFFSNVMEVRGTLTGGFQGLADELLERVDGDKIYLDDAIMGRASRYVRTYTRGGWQDTHLRKFVIEVEHLLRTKQHKQISRLPMKGGLFG